MISKLKHIVYRTLSTKRFINNYNLTTLQFIILNLFHDKKSFVFKIRPIHKLNPAEKIADGYSYISATQNNIQIKVPDLNLYIIENAIINSRSSAIAKGSFLYYEAINDNERFNEGFVKFHNTTNAIVNCDFDEIIPDGFFLAGNGSHNWYHWLIEILPKMIYFKSEYTNTILVDESCKTIPSMADSLKVFFENLNINIRYLNPQKTYKVKNIYFINEVNKLMFNPLDSTINSWPLYYYRKKTLKILSEKLKKKFLDNEFYSEKIYIKRKNTHRIAENESDLAQLLQKQGFQDIDLLVKKFGEQVNTFYNAKMIVGTTGAAWTNLLFCQPKTKVIIFMPSNYKNYQFYADMAEILDIKVTYLYYENGLQNHETSDFTIDIGMLNKLLN